MLVTIGDDVRWSQGRQVRGSAEITYDRFVRAK
jgi:hypothetical protein